MLTPGWLVLLCMAALAMAQTRVAPGVPQGQYQGGQQRQPPPQQGHYQGGAPGVPPPQQYQPPPPPPQQQQYQPPPPPQQQQQQQYQQPQQQQQQQYQSPPPPPPPLQEPQQQHYQQQPPHQQHHGGQNQRVLHNTNINAERDHIKDHLEVPIDTSGMSDQELQFHYFKMHDADNNNKLDGQELIKSLFHWHDSANHDENKAHQPTPEPKLFTDDELVNMIDPILEQDDKNKDGFIDYPEFVQAQRNAANVASKNAD